MVAGNEAHSTATAYSQTYSCTYSTEEVPGVYTNILMFAIKKRTWHAVAISPSVDPHCSLGLNLIEDGMILCHTQPLVVEHTGLSP